MTVRDLKEKLVDCNIAIAMAVSGIIYSGLIAGKKGIICSVLGLLLGALIMEIIARAGFIFAKTRAMGEADTYVAGALGSVFAVFMITKVLLYSLFVSMIFVLPVFLYNKYKADDKLTCILSVLFIMSVLIFCRGWQNYWTLALLGLTGLALAYFILKGVKTAEKHIYLPYVPALAVSALYFLFWVI